MSQNQSDEEDLYQFDIRQETEFEKLEDDYQHENNYEDEDEILREHGDQIIQKNITKVQIVKTKFNDDFLFNPKAQDKKEQENDNYDFSLLKRSETVPNIELDQDNILLNNNMLIKSSIALKKEESDHSFDIINSSMIQQILAKDDQQESGIQIANDSSGNGSNDQIKSVKKSNPNIKNINDTFQYTFREAIKKFRIPQYGAEEFQKDQSTWKLTTPQLINNSYIVYEIEGKDHIGPFNAQRRYNNFYELRNALSQNWPGIYIPSVPPKKAIGNKDIEFIVERRYFLERFFIQISSIDYLKNSQEMRIFLRPDNFGENVDIDKCLQKLSKTSNQELIVLYKKIFNISDEQLEKQIQNQQENLEKLEQTQQFLKILLNNYHLLKKQAFGMIQIKNNQLEYQKQIIKTLSRYESASQKFIKEVNQIQPSNEILKEVQAINCFNFDNSTLNPVAQLSQKLKNPYMNVFFWVKGEINDANALQQAISLRLGPNQQNIQKIKTKIQGYTADREKTLQGKMSLKTFFKSTKETENYLQKLKNDIEGQEMLLEEQEKLNGCIDFHLIELAISQFHAVKITNFTKIVKEMANIEGQNNNYSASYWSKVASQCDYQNQVNKQQYEYI